MSCRAFAAYFRTGGGFSTRKSSITTKNRRNATGFITKAFWTSSRSRKRYKTSALVARAPTRRLPMSYTRDCTGMIEFADRMGRLSREQSLYALSALPAHLADAGERERFESLLANLDFLQAKVDAFGPEPLIQDYDLLARDYTTSAATLGHVVWSKISNALKRLGFQSHNFLAQLLSETSRACTIRVRRSTLGRLWNELGSHAGLHHRHRRSRAAAEERISGCGEPYPESPGQGPAASFGS